MILKHCTCISILSLISGRDEKLHLGESFLLSFIFMIYLFEIYDISHLYALIIYLVQFPALREI